MSQEQNRTAVYVNIDTYTQNLGGYDPNDYWSCDSQRHHNTIRQYATISETQKVDPTSYGHRYDNLAVVGAEVKPGDTVYILWAEYSTGDTFHTEYGRYEIIAGFVSRELAIENAKRARDGTGGDGWDMLIELDDGTAFKYHIPWLGYFEHLEDVHVDSVTIQYKETF